MESDKTIAVEVIFALPKQQDLLSIDVPRGATLQDAVIHSGILERFPEIDLNKNRVGIFGKLRNLDDVLRPGDRVEIYRKLIADPKEVRKQRAAAGKAMKKGGGTIK